MRRLGGVLLGAPHEQGAVVKTPYVKLSRRKSGIAGNSQLWLASDHVLLVRSYRFKEEYKRFLLKDVQAIVATEWPSWMAAQIGFIVIAALFGLWAFSITSVGGRIATGLCGAVFIALAIYDIARGMRCRCVLLTQVSTEFLAPITRMSDYLRMMKLLRGAIASVQGSLQAGVGPAEQDGWTPKTAVVPAGMTYLRHALFGLLTVTAIIFAIAYVWQEQVLMYLLPTLVTGEMVIAVMLLIRPETYSLDGTLKVVVALTAVFLAVDAVSGIAQFGNWIYLVAEAGRTKTAAPKFFDNNLIHWAWRFSMSWRALAAVAGLLLLVFGSEDKGGAPSQD